MRGKEWMGDGERERSWEFEVRFFLIHFSNIYMAWNEGQKTLFTSSYHVALLPHFLLFTRESLWLMGIPHFFSNVLTFHASGKSRNYIERVPVLCSAVTYNTDLKWQNPPKQRWHDNFQVTYARCEVLLLENVHTIQIGKGRGIWLVAYV